jgi:hypothetical protein
MHGGFGPLTDINESAGGCQEPSSRILGPPDQQDASIISLDENGYGHRGIEVQPKTAGGADHRFASDRRGDGFSATWAMVELAGGMHVQGCRTGPIRRLAPLKYGFGKAAENQIDPGFWATRSLQHGFCEAHC